MSTEHLFKTWPNEFQMSLDGWKTHEVRDTSDRAMVNDGDRVVLAEWDPRTEEFTGRWIRALVKHVTLEETYTPAFSSRPRFNGLLSGVQVFSFERLEVGLDYEAIPDDAVDDGPEPIGLAGGPDGVSGEVWEELELPDVGWQMLTQPRRDRTGIVAICGILLGMLAGIALAKLQGSW